MTITSGNQLLGHADCIPAIGGFPHDFTFPLAIQDRAQTFSNDFMVVRDQHFHHCHFFPRGCLRIRIESIKTNGPNAKTVTLNIEYCRSGRGDNTRIAVVGRQDALRRSFKTKIDAISRAKREKHGLQQLTTRRTFKPLWPIPAPRTTLRVT